MKRRIILTALLLLLTGCQKETPELARKVPTAEEAEENETSAISSVKKIVTAQLDYSEGVGGGYAIKAEKPRLLFEESYRYTFPTGVTSNYDITAEQFVMVKEETTQINVVLNWFEELKRLVPRTSAA